MPTNAGTRPITVTSVNSSQRTFSLVGTPKDPLVVCYGAGVDSTAMLIELCRRNMRPDVVLFADTGSEKPATYAYLATMNEWLRGEGFPEITIVKNRRPRSGDLSLGDALLRNSVLPALSFGQHQCSLVWKIAPSEAFVRRRYGWSGQTKTWLDGISIVTKAIGYDASPRDRARAGKAHGKDSEGFRNWYPLIEFGITRDACVSLIEGAGLPVPSKSACFFCPASHKSEIDDLGRQSPELLRDALRIEDRARARGLRAVKGLARRWAWRDYVENEAPEDVRKRVLGLAD